MKKILLFSLLCVLALVSTSCGASSYKETPEVISESYYEVLERIDVLDSDIFVISCDKKDDTTYAVTYKVETPKDLSTEDSFNSRAYVQSITTTNGNEYTPKESSSYFGGYAIPETSESGKTMTTDVTFDIPKDEKVDFINIISGNGDVIKVKGN